MAALGLYVAPSQETMYRRHIIADAIMTARSVFRSALLHLTNFANGRLPPTQAMPPSRADLTGATARQYMGKLPKGTGGVLATLRLINHMDSAGRYQGVMEEGKLLATPVAREAAGKQLEDFTAHGGPVLDLHDVDDRLGRRSKLGHSVPLVDGVVADDAVMKSLVFSRGPLLGLMPSAAATGKACYPTGHMVYHSPFSLPIASPPCSYRCVLQFVAVIACAPLPATASLSAAVVVEGLNLPAHLRSVVSLPAKVLSRVVAVTPLLPFGSVWEQLSSEQRQQGIAELIEFVLSGENPFALLRCDIPFNPSGTVFAWCLGYHPTTKGSLSKPTKALVTSPEEEKGAATAVPASEIPSTLTKAKEEQGTPEAASEHSAPVRRRSSLDSQQGPSQSQHRPGLRQTKASITVLQPDVGPDHQVPPTSASFQAVQRGGIGPAGWNETSERKSLLAAKGSVVEPSPSLHLNSASLFDDGNISIMPSSSLVSGWDSSEIDSPVASNKATWRQPPQSLATTEITFGEEKVLPRAPPTQAGNVGGEVRAPVRPVPRHPQRRLSEREPKAREEEKRSSMSFQQSIQASPLLIGAPSGPHRPQQTRTRPTGGSGFRMISSRRGRPTHGILVTRDSTFDPPKQKQGGQQLPESDTPRPKFSDNVPSSSVALPPIVNNEKESEIREPEGWLVGGPEPEGTRNASINAIYSLLNQ